MMKKILLASLFGLSITFPAVANQDTSVEQVQPVIQGIWIDVRSPEEYAEGHLQNAINIPVERIVEQISQVNPDKGKPINLYCRSGYRAGLALQELNKLGYTNVTNHGGYKELLAKGFR